MKARFTRAEIEGARRLRALGLVWRPRVGDWFATDDGFVSFLTGNGDGLHAARHHTWMPGWAECRQWLRARGFTHPEFARDDDGDTRIEVIGPGGEILVGTGATDLECIYAIMAQVLSKEHG